MNTLVTFDLSSNTGVAWGTDQHRAPVPALWKLSDNFDRALCGLRQQSMALFQATKATHVAFEKAMVKIGSGHSARSLVWLKSLEAVVREAATRHGLQAPVKGVDPSTWRKTFLGKGNMKRLEAKEAAMARCRQLGWEYLDDDNVAEANGLWYHAAATFWPRWRP